MCYCCHYPTDTVQSLGLVTCIFWGGYCILQYSVYSIFAKASNIKQEECFHFIVLPVGLSFFFRTSEILDSFNCNSV